MIYFVMTLLLEAINQSGGISADWVLVGVTSILGVILIAMVRRVLNKIDDHDNRLAVNEKDHARFDERINSGIEINNVINKQQDDKLDKIFRKLESIHH